MEKNNKDLQENLVEVNDKNKKLEDVKKMMKIFKKNWMRLMMKTKNRMTSLKN